MIKQIDFLHNTKNTDEYFIDPKIVTEQIVRIVNNSEWSKNDSVRFTLLNRLLWCVSVLDTIDDYTSYNEAEIHTFFLAYSIFIDILNNFDKNSPGTSQSYFLKTISELNFPRNIIRTSDGYKFSRFIRALLVAHTASTSTADGFITKGSYFVLISADSCSVSPTYRDLISKPEAFYIHTLLRTNSGCKNLIFKIYIDEIKTFLSGYLNNRNLARLKVVN